MEIEYVFDFVKELSSATETRILWRAWLGILEHYTKAVSALRRATDVGSSKAWSDSLIQSQRSDPILLYAYQARDTATHVFEQQRDAEPKRVTVGNFISISGNSHVTMENNLIIDGRGEVHHLPNGTLQVIDGCYAGGTIPREAVVERNHFLVVADVRNRSGTWKIPNEGTSPEGRAIEIASYVANWLSQRLDEAKMMAAEEEN